MYKSTKKFLKAFYADNECEGQEIKCQNLPEIQSWNQTNKKEPLSKRTKLALLIYFLLIPFVIYFGMKIGSRKYLTVSLVLMIMAMAPFFLIFEKRKPKARELIVIAVLVGIAVAGRMAFFMLPQFKPVTALIIIAAVSFGAETGFLVGALSALASNIFFTQGPWTPWQMFAFGMVGFISGLCHQTGLLRPNRIALSFFGFVSCFVIYGVIMNAASLFMYSSVVTKEALLATFIYGVPMDLIHGVSTFIFLLFFSKPMLEKLDRIKIKYGLIY